ncbi:MAG TPA: redoxin domain-containing protein [Gemmatimonadales bacterium]|nr:redoxin domain-containing protein [Gemmatimonadales bacterium]
MHRLVRPGDAAPDAALPSSGGAMVRLSDLWRDTHVLLVFYPGNDTPG